MNSRFLSLAIISTLAWASIGASVARNPRQPVHDGGRPTSIHKIEWTWGSYI